MTLAFYQLDAQPFGALPDPRFLYMGVPQRQALASLLQALQAGRGFAAFIANGGVGKTVLISHALHSFGNGVATIYMLATAQTRLDVLRSILGGLGIHEPEAPAHTMLSRLEEVLREEHRLGRRIVAVIDEAQNLDASAFDLLYTLSNHETPRGRLIQFLLCGQSQIIGKLAAIKPMQSMQRGSVVRLESLSARDTAHYIEHRLRIARYSRPSPCSRSMLLR